MLNNFYKQALLSLVLPGVLISAVADAGSERETSERPRLQEYDDPDRFIADVLAWERRQRQGKTEAASAEPDQRSRQESGDWHDITGPETLDEALRKARGYTPPDYEAQYRFNRTTHLSFPLPRLKGNQMSGQAITGGLRKQVLEDRSLEPLPELRTILEEAGDQEGLTIPEHREELPTLSGPRRRTVHVQAR